MSDNWIQVIGENDALAGKFTVGSLLSLSMNQGVPGDRVFHWIDGTHSGLYAVSEIVSVVDSAGREAHCTHVPAQPIPKLAVAENAFLQNTAFLRRNRNRAYRLSGREAYELARLCQAEPHWFFDPAKIADMLELDLDDPTIKSADGWAEKVCDVIQPFYDALKSWGRPRFKKLRYRRREEAPKGRSSLSSCYLSLNNNIKLGVLCGIDKGLFAGLSCSGREEQNQEVERLWASELPPGLELSRKPVELFGGTWVLAGKFLTASEVRQMSPKQLLDEVMKALQLADTPPANVETPPSAGSLLDDFSNYCWAQGFRFPPEVLATYALALKSKPFVILSGISGTGKTKIAELFAEFISPATDPPPAPKSPASSGALFTSVLRPYTLKHRKLHIPLDHWKHFPPLESGESCLLTLETPHGMSEAKLFNFKVEARPDGVYQVYPRKAALEWLQSLQIGQRISWNKTPQGFRLDLETSEDSAPAAGPTRGRRAVAFIPVRPDWTDNRGLTGFAHMLLGTYQATEFLRLLLRAHLDPEKWPHFLLLDEMNLARVEHYFSDFLSALETRRAANSDEGCIQSAFPLHDHSRCLLQSGAEDASAEFFDAESPSKTCRVRCSGCPWAPLVESAHRQVGDSDYVEAVNAGFDPVYFVPPRLEIPWNVFFTGTVNVDETTYTFSPKVLDRAHVIEFNQVDLDDYLTNSGGSNGTARHATREQVQDWTDDFRYPFTLTGRREARDNEDLSPYCRQLAEINQFLSDDHLHFGFRVFDEILTYLHNAVKMDLPQFQLERAFDRVLLQKVMVRFHGSQSKLRAALLKLLAFCSESQQDETAEVRLPLTAAKVKRLLKELESSGFATSL